MLAKRIVLALLVLTGLALGSLPALAIATNINLPGSRLTGGVIPDLGYYGDVTRLDLGTTSQPLTFTGTGSSNSVSLDLGSCSGGTCSLTGVALGYGLFSYWAYGLPPTRGGFIITSPANITLKETGTDSYGLPLWTAETNGNAIKFSYGPGGSLLTGYINMLQFEQLPAAVSHGQDRYLGSSNLNVTGGSFDFTGHSGFSNQYLVVNSPAYYNTLLGSSNTGKTISTKWGEGPMFPTPEPASLLLLGSGFLLAGGVVRSRFRQRLWRA